MISERDKKSIITLAEKYKVSRLLLFGSSVHATKEPNDIDLGVEGLDDKLFFKFYSELIFNVSKPVDLIPIDQKSSFNEIVAHEGVVLYG